MSSSLIKEGEVQVVEFSNMVSDQTSGEGAERGQPGGPQGRGDGPQKSLEEIEREAFQKGYEAGEGSGLQIAEQKTAVVLRKLGKSLEELAGLRRQIVSEGEKDLIRLAIAIAKKLVHREIKIDEQIIVTLVRVALERLIEKSQITVRVHPSDHKVLLEYFSEISQGGADSTLTLKIDDQLNRGDCLVESDCGNVDARISEQFQTIEKGLLTGF